MRNMKTYKIIIVAFLVFICSVASVSIFRPQFISNSSFGYVFESSNLNTVLLLANIIFTIILFLYSDYEQINSTIISFQTTTASFSPGIDTFARVSPYVYQAIIYVDSVFAQLHYLVLALKECNPARPLIIPLTGIVQTTVDGINIELSRLKIEVLKEGDDTSTLSLPIPFEDVFLDIKQHYKSGTSINLFFLLFLSKSTYNSLLDKIIIIKFDVCFTSVKEKRLRKKMKLIIHNSCYGLHFLGQCYQ